MLLCCVAVTEIPSASELELQSLNERTKIRSGVVEIEATKQPASKPNPKYSLTFDGPLLRSVVEMSLAHGLPDGSLRNEMNKHYFVFTQDHQLYYTNFSPDGKSSVAASKRDLRDPAYMAFSNAYLSYKIDPRKLGVVYQNICSFDGISNEDILAYPNWQDSRVEREIVDGETLWRIRHVGPAGLRTSLLIAPDRGYSVLETSVQSDIPPKKPMIDKVVSEVQQYGPEGIWFPKTSVYTRQLDDEVVMTETYEVVRAEFNIPVAAETFTLAGMDIPAGTMVAENPRRNPTRFWDGEKLVIQAELPGVRPQAMQPLAEVSETGTNWWLLGLANGLVLLSITLFAVRRHILRRSSHPAI